MARTGQLTVKLRGETSSFVSAGLIVPQAVDADAIAGDGILFDVKGEDFGWWYNSSTDTVLIVTTDGFSEALTRYGDYFQWIIGANDLGSPATAPGASVSKTARIVVERLTAGAGTAITRLESQSFALTIERARAFSPQSIDGLVLWVDAYDLTEAVAAVIASWDDKTLFERDMDEATNKPTRRNTGAGRPYALFDGSNDLLTSVLADLGTACTIAFAGFIDTYDATVRGVVQVGGTNGARLAFDNANLKGISGSDIANTTLPSLDTWFVGIVTKTASGAITVQKGTAAAVSAASSAAVTAGAVVMADTPADAAAAIGAGELCVYNSVLTAAQINSLVRYLQTKWQATG